MFSPWRIPKNIATLAVVLFTIVIVGAFARRPLIKQVIFLLCQSKSISNSGRLFVVSLLPKTVVIEELIESINDCDHNDWALMIDSVCALDLSDVSKDLVIKLAIRGFTNNNSDIRLSSVRLVIHTEIKFDDQIFGILARMCVSDNDATIRLSCATLIIGKKQAVDANIFRSAITNLTSTDLLRGSDPPQSVCLVSKDLILQLIHMHPSFQSMIDPISIRETRTKYYMIDVLAFAGNYITRMVYNYEGEPLTEELVILDGYAFLLEPCGSRKSD